MCTHMHTHPHLPHSCSCPEPSVNTGNSPDLPTTLPLVLTRALSRVPDSVACLKDFHCCPGSGLCHQAPRLPPKAHPHSRAAAGGRGPAHEPLNPQGASPTLTQVARTNPSTVSGAFVPLIPPLPQQDYQMPEEARLVSPVSSPSRPLAQKVV